MKFGLKPLIWCQVASWIISPTLTISPLPNLENGIHFHVSVYFTKLDRFLALFPDGGKFGRRTGEEAV
ncbi:hypothetical protein PAPYR_3912 [Paratrimastix pyriformis]|uniref:Uncharacterized protein n=1 Tax=Paratrimastix pyriformis TaxID=342808 RepID=A0ABQ8UQN9_9EUKA|nr:hypothetical protein PAPYR_3912 [Paratrimastix pyriformis]